MVLSIAPKKRLCGYVAAQPFLLSRVGRNSIGQAQHTDFCSFVGYFHTAG
jgi:hypothetical protein